MFFSCDRGGAYICVVGAGAWLDSGRRLVVGVVLAGLKRDAADPFPRLAFEERRLSAG